MVRKLNNRGYVLVEIILASAITFAIAYYMLDLTIKLKNKNDDLLVETLVMTDQAIIENRFMQYILSEQENFDCSEIEINNNVISYTNDSIDIVNKYTNIDSNSLICNNDGVYIQIYLPLEVTQINKLFDVNIYYILDNNL